MTTLRLETRQSLKWCLEQSGHFTAPQLQAHTGSSQTVANKHLRKFYEMGLLKRAGSTRQWVYWVHDKQLATEFAEEKIGDKSRHIVGKKRSHKAQRKVNVWLGSNSVFGARL
jgi:predicted transcriptional regulator